MRGIKVLFALTVLLTGAVLSGTGLYTLLYQPKTANERVSETFALFPGIPSEAKTLLSLRPQ